MGLFSDDKDKKEKDNESEYNEQELEDYGLNPREREEVLRGNEEPWNFDEEELEDDDYYGEDDE